MTTEQETSTSFDPNSVRKTLTVQAPAEVAWRVFTQKIGAWWPLATYKIGKATAAQVIVPSQRAMSVVVAAGVPSKPPVEVGYVLRQEGVAGGDRRDLA